MLTIESLRGRVRRLNDLCRGLGKEIYRVEIEKNDPLGFPERQAYRVAIYAAVEALEQARIVLATAIQRMEDGEAKNQTGAEMEESAFPSLYRNADFTRL